MVTPMKIGSVAETIRQKIPGSVKMLFDRPDKNIEAATKVLINRINPVRTKSHYGAYDKFVQLATLLRGKNEEQEAVMINKLSKIIRESDKKVDALYDAGEYNKARQQQYYSRIKEKDIKEWESGRNDAIESKNIKKIKGALGELNNPEVFNAARDYILADTVEGEEEALQRIAELIPNLFVGESYRVNGTKQYGIDFFRRYGKNAGKKIRESLNFKELAGTGFTPGERYSYGLVVDKNGPYANFLDSSGTKFVNGYGGSIIDASKGLDLLNPAVKSFMESQGLSAEEAVASLNKNPNLTEEICKYGKKLGQYKADTISEYITKQPRAKKLVNPLNPNESIKVNPSAYDYGESYGINSGGLFYQLWEYNGKKYIVPVDNYHNLKGRSARYGGAEAIWNFLSPDEKPNVIVFPPMEVNSGNLKNIVKAIMNVRGEAPEPMAGSLTKEARSGLYTHQDKLDAIYDLATQFTGKHGVGYSDALYEVDPKTGMSISDEMLVNGMLKHGGKLIQKFKL